MRAIVQTCPRATSAPARRHRVDHVRATASATGALRPNATFCRMRIAGLERVVPAGVVQPGGEAHALLPRPSDRRTTIETVPSWTEPLTNSKVRNRSTCVRRRPGAAGEAQARSLSRMAAVPCATITSLFKKRRILVGGRPSQPRQIRCHGNRAGFCRDVFRRKACVKVKPVPQPQLGPIG